MDLRNLIEIGEKVEIIVYRDYFKPQKGFSMIQDITIKNELIVTLPMFEGRPILVNIKDRVRVLFYKEKGCYYFEGEIVDRFQTENLIMISIKRTSSVKRIQRRGYYRLKITLPVRFHILLEEETKSPALEGYCADISGSGMRLITDQKLDINTILEFQINLEDKNGLLLKGKVVRSVLSESLDGKYDTGIAFCDITDKNRDILIKYIFMKQREFRKKGYI